VSSRDLLLGPQEGSSVDVNGREPDPRATARTSTRPIQSVKGLDHLRGPDFFEVENCPRMTFTATNGHLTSEGQVELIGSLEIHGQPRPPTLRAELSNVGDPQKISSKVDIDRRAWGMSYAALLRSSTKIHVAITAYFNRA
jgi:polyisoprenoid-binding protein YceI